MLVSRSVILLALAACASTPPPPRTPVPTFDPANPGPWCAEASTLIGNPYATPGQQEQARILMDERCRGR